MKRIATPLFLCSLTLGTSYLAYAEQAVITPTLDGGVTASIGTFYALPSADNESYSTITDSSGNAIHYSVVNIDPDYDFGFAASLGYIFSETANGIELLYQSLNANDTDSFGIREEKDERNISAHVDYDLDTLDLMVSQFMDIGTQMQMRFSGGLAYVDLKQEQKTSTVDLLFDSTHDLTEKSSFKGLGPRVGIDARYEFGEGFGLLGGGSIAYYLGDLDLDSSSLSTYTNQEDQIVTMEDDLDDHAVANLRANLGVDYVLFFDNESRSTVGIELGYQVDYYADTIGNINSEALNNDSDGEPAQLFALSFSGPYLNIKGAF